MIIKYDWNNDGILQSWCKVKNVHDIVKWIEQQLHDNWYCNENGDYKSRITQVHIDLFPEYGFWILLYPTTDVYFLMTDDSRNAMFLDIRAVMNFLKFLKGSF